MAADVTVTVDELAVVWPLSRAHYLTPSPQDQESSRPEHHPDDGTP
jgi:hypothetical protein